MRVMIALLVFASVSMADTITYDMTIHWTSGLLGGTQSPGKITWDDAGLSGVGDERLFAGEWTLDLTVDGVVLNETDDISYPTTFPILFLEDGVPDGVNFLWAPNGFNAAPQLFISSDAEYTDANGARSNGTISFSGPVPEPGTFVLIGVAALGYGICRRRRKAS